MMAAGCACVSLGIMEGAKTYPDSSDPGYMAAWGVMVFGGIVPACGMVCRDPE